ncbi:metallo-beta-lactamase family protein [Agromyces flavus]|uniref:Metallo-beta-lactamase family protein n=1 Tax=Agromyces flavus TaxID=589382 RepID=A0A1H1YQN0_9MICO|nr:MBL fold metallo-hydrolase [Agromyces flavus]MCP2366772.1 metallo-beta-lactamase family protein [Agromyces flavus]GGI45339.1 MBL fold hydrolase [Agromyces flavus]SDT23642.1 metallo-beta-lactamase family protein [Agromyces flavus]
MSQESLRFLGAADTVTGSRHLLEANGTRVLVDCGLFQGYKVLRERNRRPFPVAPESIDAVVLSHAHLDHSGYLPALVRDGFRGRIFASPGTVELCRIMLTDSAYLMEEEARHAASRHWSKHADPQPLYTSDDVRATLPQFSELAFDEHREVAPGVDARLVRAGHILGAAQVRLRTDDAQLHFTGDLGRASDPLMHAPAPLEPCDVLVTESTYGDRTHSAEDPADRLGDVIRRVTHKGGVVLIPAFAVGRTETVLLHLSRLRDRGLLPAVPVYLNSPMAVDVAAIYQRYPEEHRLERDELTRMYRLATRVTTADDSKLLNLRGGPMVIISASGMLTGGRILHHLREYGPDPRNAIVLTGFQAGGTRGARLIAGERVLRIFGEDVPIRAEVVSVDSMSAHPDADEMMDWLRAAPSAPSATYVTHGEPNAADALRVRITRELGWDVRVPDHSERVRLGGHEDPVLAVPTTARTGTRRSP